MSNNQPTRQALRIGPRELKTRLEAGEPMTILDARNRSDWEPSPIKIRGALRFHSSYFQNPPAWPHEQLTVVY